MKGVKINHATSAPATIRYVEPVFTPQVCHRATTALSARKLVTLRWNTCTHLYSAGCQKKSSFKCHSVCERIEACLHTFSDFALSFTLHLI